MIIKGEVDPDKYYRKIYPVNGENITVKHFVVRTISPDNPFKSHKHEQEELWYILSGEAVYIENGKEYNVAPGDLIHITQWLEHGLRTASSTSWICLG